MVNRLQADPSFAVAYFYCDSGYSLKQDPRIIVGSLCKQLVSQLASLGDEKIVQPRIQHLVSLFKSFKLGRMKQHQLCEQLWQALYIISSIFARSLQVTCAIVIDALDECSDKNNLASLLRGLTSLTRYGPKVFIASRPDKDTESSLEREPHHRITINSSVVDADISKYVDFRLDNEEKFRCLKPNMKQEIRERLMGKSGGM